MLALKLTAVGKSTGVILPKEALKRLHLRKGDRMILLETRGGFVLSPWRAEMDRQKRLTEESVSRCRDGLRSLAEGEAALSKAAAGSGG